MYDIYTAVKIETGGREPLIALESVKATVKIMFSMGLINSDLDEELLMSELNKINIKERE